MRGFGLSDIEEKWKAEKSQMNITELSDDFYENVASYISELRRERKEGKDLKREILEEEIEKVLDMSYEIHLLRMSKLASQVLEGEKSQMAESERIAFEKAREEIENLYRKRFEPIIEGKSELEPPREISNVLVLFNTDIPEKVIGSDMNYYGPFKSGDFANLPEKSAEIFTERGLARKVKIREE